MPKKLLLILASIFLIWQSYRLLVNIQLLQLDAWIVVLINAFLINLYITGIFAFAGFALPTQKLMPKAYYNIKNPSQLKWIYKSFNVDAFRKFLLATFWKDKQQRKKYFNGRADGIKNLELQSMKSEFGHLIPFVIILVIGIYLIILGLVELGFLTLVINWIGNWYPVILQRHHRMRISRLLKYQ